MSPAGEIFYTLEPAKNPLDVLIRAPERTMSRKTTDTRVYHGGLTMGDYVEVIGPNGQKSYLGRLRHVIPGRESSAAKDALAVIHDGKRDRYERYMHLQLPKLKK